MYYLRIGDPVLESAVLVSLERFGLHLATQLMHLDDRHMSYIVDQNVVGLSTRLQ